jgi:signal transduction histidine kinase
LFDFKPLILHTIEEFKDLLAKKGIQLHRELQSIQLFADPDKILQMFINLLDNAIKYNLPSNGQIWVTLDKVGENIELSISNTGVTIPEDSLAKIFDQFYRVEKSRSTMFGGAGLGLAIVQQILIIHQATIEVTSDQNGLTTFLVKFPDEVH